MAESIPCTIFAYQKLSHYVYMPVERESWMIHRKHENGAEYYMPIKFLPLRFHNNSSSHKTIIIIHDE